MKQRIVTALLLAPLAIAMMLLAPTAWVMIILAVALLLGLWEWTRLIGVTSATARIGVIAAHAAAMLMLALYGWPASFVYVATAGATFWLLACAWLLKPTLGKASAWLPLKLLAGTLMILPTWAAISLLHADGPLGPRWALFGVLLVWAADTFAYFAGSRIGGPKLAPKISPGKTWAGFWGGVIGACVICIPAAPLLGVGWDRLPVFIALGLLVAFASVIGDLFESMMKRQAGAKDSGTLIPGHGGVMDRIDSVVAALPVFVVGKLWLAL